MRFLGIRRETKNEWERRVPLVPRDVHELRKRHRLMTLIEPSELRIFPENEYVESGARVVDNLKEAKYIFGVKEIPVDYFEKRKVYVFFSHTIKAQKYNIPMLKRMLELEDTLIDYELIRDENGKRLIFFGYHAGLAGAIDTIWAYGQRLLKEGLKNPFARVKRAYEYGRMEKVESHLRDIGEEIAEEGLPPEITPMIVGITGRGNVSKGVQDIIKFFPYEEIEARYIPEAIRENKNDRIFMVVFKPEERIKHKFGELFSKEDYYVRPENYTSRIPEYLPYLNILLNGIYWEERFPRLITKTHIKELFERYENPKLKVIGDITCDIGGSIEFTEKATQPGNPCFVYDPFSDTIRDGVEGRGIVVMAVDNLPAELAYDASIFFSHQLKPFVPYIVRANYDVRFKRLNLPDEIKNAVIVLNGELTPNYKYLERYL